MTRIMLDLETLGNNPGCVIVAIGAVKFGDGKILEEFYERVDPQSCVTAGLRLEVEAVMWWLGQGDDARKEITKPGMDLRAALQFFAAWIGQVQPNEIEVWGNGENFDNVILEAAYDTLKMPRPWKFSRDRCYRTAVKLFPAAPKIDAFRSGTHHNALEDARSQALHLMAILARLETN